MNTKKLFVLHLIFRLLPPTRMFAFKRGLLRWAGAKVGTNVRVASTASFHLTGALSIGDGTWIGHDVLIVGGDAPVSIGARVDIAPRVVIVTGSHHIGTSDKAAGSGYSRPITIHNGAWIGACALVLGGVTVGSNAIVAAGAVVIHDVRERSTVGGIPAKNLSYDKS